jgi:hypothetical protein
MKIHPRKKITMMKFKIQIKILVSVQINVLPQIIYIVLFIIIKNKYRKIIIYI